MVLIKSDPFRLGEMPKDLDQYYDRLVRSFYAGVSQGKQEAHDNLSHSARLAIFRDLDR
jgi:hypothetical protein